MGEMKRVNTRENVAPFALEGKTSRCTAVNAIAVAINSVLALVKRTGTAADVPERSIAHGDEHLLVHPLSSIYSSDYC